MVITLVYEHDCPGDTGTTGCPSQGEEVFVRPEVKGAAYYPVVPRCLWTTAELKLVRVLR